MIISLKGENYTGKSTFGASCPGKVYFIETDLGGFARVEEKFAKELADGTIIHKPYSLPQDTLRANLGIVTSPRLNGIRELWMEIVGDMCKEAFDNPAVSTVVFDTFSKLYSIAIDAFLQQKQESQESSPGKLKSDQKQYREQLQQMEYREINRRMQALIDESIRCKTNLILIHHMSDQYGKVQEGDKIVSAVVGRDAKGWHSCGLGAADLADFTIHMEQGNTKKGQNTNKFYGTITKAGDVRSLKGKIIEDPTFADLASLIKLAK